MLRGNGATVLSAVVLEVSRSELDMQRINIPRNKYIHYMTMIYVKNGSELNLELNISFQRKVTGSASP